MHTFTRAAFAATMILASVMAYLQLKTRLLIIVASPEIYVETQVPVQCC
jgi:hypothetical protein